jgi:hypothetical protein
LNQLLQRALEQGAFLFSALVLTLGQSAHVAPESAAQDETEFVFDPGGDWREVRLPADEALTYLATIELGFVNASAGTVTVTSKVEPYRSSVLLPTSTDGAEDLSQVVLGLRARGEHNLYSLDSMIETRILPQAWPRILHTVVNRGSEKRSRELLLGMRGGESLSSYRKDTDKGAPKGTRIWREPKERPIPEGTLDLLSAVYHTRTLVREGLDAVSFPLLDKDRLWEMTLRRGERRTMETPAGTFDVVEVSLQPKPFPGESISQKKVEKFEGILGLRGSIRLWADARTGVPVRIEGDMPVGPLTLGVDIILESFEGTPEGFEPLSESPPK